MRIHSTSSLGLPRVVPFDRHDFSILGHPIPAGTVVSVPAYTIHHSKEIWGEDADLFNPDRWRPENLTPKQKASFIPFSHGPRACVGRNVAEMEMTCIVGTTFKNFEFEMQQKPFLETREGFLRKPVELIVGIKRRS